MCATIQRAGVCGALSAVWRRPLSARCLSLPQSCPGGARFLPAGRPARRTPAVRQRRQWSLSAAPVGAVRAISGRFRAGRRHVGAQRRHRRRGGLDDRTTGCTAKKWTGACACPTRGWEVYAVPQVRVDPSRGQSSRQVRWWAYVRLWRSRFRFYARHRHHYPPGHLAAVRLLVRVGVARQRRAIERAAFARGEITGDGSWPRRCSAAAVAQL